MTPSSSGPAVVPDGTIEPTPTGAVLRFERQLPHPVVEVWAAITEPARLADWLPFDAHITVDLRPGGRMVVSANGDKPVTITCEIPRIEPPMLFEHTHVSRAYACCGSSRPTATAASSDSAMS